MVWCSRIGHKGHVTMNWLHPGVNSESTSLLGPLSKPHSVWQSAAGRFRDEEESRIIKQLIHLAERRTFRQAFAKMSRDADTGPEMSRDADTGPEVSLWMAADMCWPMASIPPGVWWDCRRHWYRIYEALTDAITIPNNALRCIKWNKT